MINTQYLQFGVNQSNSQLEFILPLLPDLLMQVLKVDVEAALQVLNFAIYHKELTDMEEREQRERELDLKNRADQDAGNDGGNVEGGGK